MFHDSFYQIKSIHIIKHLLVFFQFKYSKSKFFWILKSYNQRSVIWLPNAFMFCIKALRNQNDFPTIFLKNKTFKSWINTDGFSEM